MHEGRQFDPVFHHVFPSSGKIIARTLSDLSYMIFIFIEYVKFNMVILDIDITV